MINLNQAKLMNEESWIETNFFLLSLLFLLFFPLLLSLAFPIRHFFPILQISSSVSSNSSSFLLFLLRKKLKKKFSK